MKPPNRVDPNQHFYNQLNSALSSQRFVLGFIGIGLIIILLFGILVFAIVFGLLFGFILLALTFDLPYRLLRQIFRFQDLPHHLVKLPTKRIAFHCSLLVMPAFFIFIGLKGLQNIGFCSQALICAFGRLISP